MPRQKIIKGGGIGAAGAAMAAPPFSSNMGHALWTRLKVTGYSFGGAFHAQKRDNSQC